MDLEARLARLAERLTKLELAAAARAAAAPAPAAAAAEEADPEEWTPIARDPPEVAAVRGVCKTLGLRAVKFQWVPSNYYEEKLAWRRDQLSAPSVNFLCKCIVLENTHCVNDDCSDRNNAKYYAAVFQYVTKFDAEKLMKYVRSLNEGVGKKKFNFRLASEGEKVTGFVPNAVVPFGMKTDMPIIMSEDILKLAPRYFWLGGGHVDCKVRVDTDEFIRVLNPHVAPIAVPYTPEELDQM